MIDPDKPNVFMTVFLENVNELSRGPHDVTVSDPENAIISNVS